MKQPPGCDLRLGGSRSTTVLLVVAALALVPLSLLNLHGRRVGRMLSWIVVPVAFVGNLFLAADRATVRSGPPAGLRRIDARALLDAAHGARPAWVSSLPDVRFGVVVAAGLLAVALLAAPSARRYFREDEQVEWLDI